MPQSARWIGIVAALGIAGIIILFLVIGRQPVAAEAMLQANPTPSSTLNEPSNPSPLPRGCRGFTPVGEPEPVCCISGYVFLDGVPLEGADVTIQSPTGESISLQTQRLPDSSYAYYRLDLTNSFATPINPGDELTITASAQGITRTIPYTVAANGQQVDMVLPRERVDDLTLTDDQIWQSAPTGLFFNSPMATTVDSQGNIYVVDRDNARVQKFDAAWNLLTMWGTLGSGDGEFWNPTDITVDSQDFIYVTDTYNHRLQKFDAAGNFIDKWGSYGELDGFFRNPRGIAIDINNNIYVADTDNNRIQVFDSNLTHKTNYSLPSPRDLAIDNQNALYVTSNGDNVTSSVDDKIRKCTRSSEFGSCNWSIWNSVTLSNPGGIALQTNSVYTADTGNSRIQKFNTSGGLAATRTEANGKSYRVPEGIFATANFVYVADTGNHRIVTTTLTLNLTTVGEKGIEGNGPGQFHDPQAFALDSMGNFYVVDSRFNQVKVIDGNGQPLRVLEQAGETGLSNVIVDRQQNVYVVVNSGTPHILKFDAQGSLTQSWNLPNATTVHDIELWNQTLYLAVQFGVGTPAVRIDKYSTNGSKAGEISAPGNALLHDLTIDSQGQIYAVDSSGQMWRSAGTNAWTSWGNLPQNVTPTKIAVNRANRLFVISDSTLLEVDQNGSLLARLDRENLYLNLLNKYPELTEFSDVQVTADGMVYTADRLNNRIQIFEAPTFSDPIATINQIPRTTLTLDETFVAYGRGQDSDESDQIDAYQWVADVESNQPIILGNDRFLSVIPRNAGLTAGRHSVSLRVQDDEGRWSDYKSVQDIYVTDPATTWGMLLYLDGDYRDGESLLRRYNAALNNFLNSSAGQANVVVAALVDGPGNGDTQLRRLFYNTTTGRWEEITVSEVVGEKAMDDPATLTWFLNWAKTNLSAQFHYLAIANHGQAIRGIAWDLTSDRADDGVENFSAYLTVAEVGAAIQAADIDIDVLHLDACSMNLLEVGYELREVAQILIASQYLGWDYFAYHQYANAIFPGASAEQVAEAVVQRYANLAGSDNQPYTISALDLVKMADSTAQLNALASTLTTLLNNQPEGDQTLKNYLNTVRDASQSFDSDGNYQNNPSDFYIDLLDWSERLLTPMPTPEADIEAQAAALQGALDQLIIAQRAGSGQLSNGTPVSNSGAHGASIFYATNRGSQSYIDYLNGDLFAFTGASTWDEFIAFGRNPLSGITPTPPPPPLTVLTSTLTITTTPTATPSATPTGTPTPIATIPPTATHTPVVTASDTPLAITRLSNVMQIAAGTNHTCALLTNGRVKCWGRNGNLLGNGSTIDSTLPVDVVNLAGVTAIAAGGGHTCALVNDGSVMCWGSNGQSQLGDGTTTASTVPVAVTGLSNVQAITAGASHTCALSNGGVKCWGSNNVGQVGNNSTASTISSPASVANLTQTIRSVSAAGDHTCAVRTDDATFCWGDNQYGQLGNYSTTSSRFPVLAGTLGQNSGVRTVTAGTGYSCAIMDTDTLKCWGDNRQGQFGDNTTASSVSPMDISTIDNVHQLSLGTTHTCAVTTQGYSKCWGKNNYGQLGDNSTTQRLVPFDPTGLSANVVSVSVGTSHTCALLTDGTVACWGYNSYGQLGNGLKGNNGISTIPLFVIGLPNNISALAAGQNHSCAILGNTAIQCWGDNGSGRLGDGTSTDQLAPVSVVNLNAEISAVAAGWTHTCAVTTGSTIKCWGSNNGGQLGNGTTTNSSTPVNVQTINSAVSVATGSNRTCTVLEGGRVLCWGNGVTLPQDVQGLYSGTAGITIGKNHYCAWLTDGTARCWGTNTNGQLGTGAGNSSIPTPIFLTGTVTVTSMSAGSDHTCALTNTHTVYCWGLNSAGQIGNGQSGNNLKQLLPTQVLQLEGATMIAAGDNHSCALLNNGLIKCWGENGQGQLGDGTIIDHRTPVVVADIQNARAVAAGGEHTCAWLNNDTVHCWGTDVIGQLGDGNRLSIAPDDVLQIVPVALGTTPTPPPSPTPTATQTTTPSPTGTATPTSIPTDTPSPTPTATPTLPPTATATTLPTEAPTTTMTPTAIATPTASATETNTVTPTVTAIPTDTVTATETSTPISTATSTTTATPTAIDGPHLTIPAAIPGAPGTIVTVPVQLESREDAVALTIFSLDFDQTCLSFDPTDADADTIPDAVHFLLGTGFRGDVTVDLTDTNGELDFTIGDFVAPLSPLPDGALVTVAFTVRTIPECRPVAPTTVTAAIDFSQEPLASFGTTTGDSVPGATLGGTVTIAELPGNCNGDTVVDAGDITAGVLEIFDNDGIFWLDASGGTYPGTPSCDTNRDTRIDAGDITCMLLVIFNAGHACTTPGVANATQATAVTLTLGKSEIDENAQLLQVPLRLTSNGTAAIAATVGLRFDPSLLTFDVSDANGDEIPDALTLTQSNAGHQVIVQVDAEKGELYLFFADMTATPTVFADGLLGTITFRVQGEAIGNKLADAITFSNALSASFGSVDGQSIPVQTEIATSTIQIYLPMIRNE